MNTRLIAICGLCLAIGAPASAHRLDEYLQATTISVEQGRIQAQMRLTPGVAVFPGVFANMDIDGNGVLSAAEERAYAERALRDVSLAVDAKPLKLRLVSWQFATTTELQAGRGEIQLEFTADVSPTGGNRRLVFENHHQSRIAVYLVNCLVPQDSNIQVTAQKRNYLQSRYELDYTQFGVPVPPRSGTVWSGDWGWTGAVALLLIAPLLGLWRRTKVSHEASVQQDGALSRETASSEGRRT